MSVNLTNVTESLTIYDQLVHLNYATDGLVGVMFVFTIALIVFLVFKQREGDTLNVLIFDAVLTSFLCVLLMYGDLIGFKVFIIPFVLFLGAILTKVLSD